MTATMDDRSAAAANDAYLAAVRAALAGVPDSDRQELLDDLAEHLAELAHEPDTRLFERLGPPEQYAAELLASAGIEPASSGRARQQIVERAQAIAARFDTPVPRRVRSFWRELQPGWWVLRGWLVVAALASRSGLQHALWIPNVLNNRLVDFVLLVGAVVVSVRIGRGRKWMAWAASALGVLALISVLHADRSNFYQSAYVGYNDPTTGTLVAPNGGQITNVFAYDTSGRPIPGVFLVDQDGDPLDVGDTSALSGSGTPVVSGLFPRPVVITDDAGNSRVVQPKPPRFATLALPPVHKPAAPAKHATVTTVNPWAPTTVAPPVTVVP